MNDIEFQRAVKRVQSNFVEERKSEAVRLATKRMHAELVTALGLDGITAAHAARGRIELTWEQLLAIVARRSRRRP